MPKQKRGFRTGAEAGTYLNEQMAAVDRGEVIASGLTFQQHWDEWLAKHRVMRTSPGLRSRQATT